MHQIDLQRSLDGHSRSVSDSGQPGVAADPEARRTRLSGMNEASGPAARATDQAKDAAKKGEAAGGGSGSREVAGDLDIPYRGRGALGRWL